MLITIQNALIVNSLRKLMIQKDKKYYTISVPVCLAEGSITQ